MQIIHDFGISPIEYFKNGKNNQFPEISRCPDCHDLMIKNGFYQRFVITPYGTYIIFIRRYRCQHCNHTVSILPSFLIPRFQRSLQFIFQCLKEYFFNRNYLLSHRQVHIYCSRFRKNIPGIISFFRDRVDKTLAFGKTVNKKAIKLIEMIKSFPTPTFSRRYYNHSNKSFMAL